MNEQKSRKTAIYLSLLVAIVFTLSACTGQESKKEPSNDNKPVAEKKVEKVTDEDDNDNNDASEETITKQDLANLILNSEFDSPEFLSNLQFFIQELEMQAAAREASEKKDVSFCSKISKQEFRENCIDNFNYQQAFEQKDIALCEKISKEFQKQDCVNQVNYQLAIENADMNACDKITEDYQKRDCKNSVAYTKARNDLDESVCDLIDNEETKTMCQEDIRSMKEVNEPFIEGITTETLDQPEPYIEETLEAPMPIDDANADLPPELLLMPDTE